MLKHWLGIGLLIALATSSVAHPIENVAESKPLIFSSQVVGHNVLITNHAIIAKDVAVAGDAFIIAGKAEINGHVQGNATIVAGQVTINGHVHGDLMAIAGNVDINPTAVIDGNLQYVSSSSLNIASGAQIKGKVEAWHEKEVTHDDIIIEQTSSHKFPVLFYSGLLLVGFIFCKVFPQFSSKLLEHVRQRPWFSLFIGFASFCIIPVIIITSLISIIGIPFSIILLMLYIAILWLSYIYAAWIIGSRGLRLISANTALHKTFSIIISLLIGLAILYGFGLIPFVGSWLKAMALLLGLGGIVLTLLRSREAVLI